MMDMYPIKKNKILYEKKCNFFRIELNDFKKK